MADICFIGEDKPGSRAPQRLRAMESLGHSVRFFRSHPAGETYETPPGLARRLRHRLRRPADRSALNRALVRAAAETPTPDVIWVDYTLTILPSTLRALRRRCPETTFIWYSEDDMMQPHNGSVWLDRSLPMFDLWVTTKSFNADPGEMPARGARNVLFVNNSFDPGLHSPVEITPEERGRLAADISFVGTYEPDRAASLRRLADEGFSVRVWGNGWPDGPGDDRLRIERRPVYGRELAAVYAASAINLAFLRRRNRDLQTCRTIEIPACGGFMLHSRNDEVLSLLTENEEAGYFAADDELVSACRHWLSASVDRNRVARAGHLKVVSGGFSHADRIREILAAAGHG